MPSHTGACTWGPGQQPEAVTTSEEGWAEGACPGWKCSDGTMRRLSKETPAPAASLGIERGLWPSWEKQQCWAAEVVGAGGGGQETAGQSGRGLQTKAAVAAATQAVTHRWVSLGDQGGCEGRLYPCCSVAQGGCRESLRRKGALWRKPLSSFWAVTGGHMLATGLLEGRRAHRQEEIRRTPSPEQVLVEPCSSFHLLPIKCWGAQQKWLHRECRGRRMVHQLCQMKPPSTKAAHLQPRP